MPKISNKMCACTLHLSILLSDSLAFWNIATQLKLYFYTVLKLQIYIFQRFTKIIAQSPLHLEKTKDQIQYNVIYQILQTNSNRCNQFENCVQKHIPTFKTERSTLLANLEAILYA